MAATCGTCKAPNQTIAHIRSCGGAVPTASALPQLHAGNVVTLANEPGFWTVEHVPADGGKWIGATQVRAENRSGETSRTAGLEEVELVFANANAAADWRIAQAAAVERERVSQALHGRPAQERGYYASKHETRGDATEAVVEAGERLHRAHANTQSQVNPWGPVDELRKQVVEHLHYETSQGGTTKRMGHFAVKVDGSDDLKFLRVKKILSGRYAGRVFVDSMGSDTGYPVKSPATLTMYLTAVLVDPAAAAKRYADELGTCSDCGRPLTNELSRQRGIGPDCWDKR